MRIKNLKKLLWGLFIASAFLISPTNLYSQTTVIKGNFTTKNDDGSHTITVKNDKHDFRIEYEGDISISDDDKEITAISKNGYIEIRKTRFGKRRRLFIESEGGSLSYRYFVGSKELPYNPDGKKWLAEILPEIVRTTKIAAESRVERFYKKGGVKAVMREVGKIESDYVKAAYIKILLKKNINNSELVNVINTVGDEVKSDYYVSQILKSNQKRFLATNATKTAYINAVKNVKSDYYTSQILKAVINDSKITDQQMADMLEITRGISSGHYLSKILTSVMENRDLNSQNMKTIMDLTDQVKSDYYKSQILKKALKKEGISKTNYDAFLSTLSNIKSDHYTTQIINDLLGKNLNSQSLSKLLKLADENVKSDYSMSNLYKKLAKQNDLSESLMIQLIESASNRISSGYYLSNVLIAYSGKVKSSSQRVKDAYTKAAKSIKSETYFGRAMKALY